MIRMLIKMDLKYFTDQIYSFFQKSGYFEYTRHAFMKFNIHRVNMCIKAFYKGV